MTSETSDSKRTSLREEHGRSMNNVYSLPVDKPERKRLDKQHRMWKRLLGGNGLYFAEACGLIREVLEPKNASEMPFIMDIGSGSGIWAVEMAELFPHAEVIGLDLVESKPPIVPSNCRFITKDILSGLEEYTGKVDIVHARSVISHLPSTDSFIGFVYNCLKPGGIFLLGDGNPTIYDENGKEFEPASLDTGVDNTNKSWMALLMNIYLNSMETKLGPRIIMGKTQDDLMSKEPRLEVRGRKTFFDLLNCPEGDTDLSKSSGAAFAAAVKPAVLGAGVSSETVERIVDNVYQEVTGPMKAFSRWDITWAIKQT
ncbi:S-adenosyl-L-methionine-dependent methyltransferase [Schizopora paradoxa]|uniref:S-adenosyl-L-methionine-dependent methyltransferase n=1 Tax=Schizopora paradoxa TaxID=27342 RepID=A0A0H2RM24_9AGAM|nr:S-adenosyl-L-methionine-dependent methyltransferase [Schizopora paradoxa]